MVYAPILRKPTAAGASTDECSVVGYRAATTWWLARRTGRSPPAVMHLREQVFDSREIAKQRLLDLCWLPKNAKPSAARVCGEGSWA